MPYGLPSISYASTIVGFTSFTFTFFTFVRVFWEAILTLWSAPKEMVGLLDNLRSELHGERAYFKAQLRRQRSRSRGAKIHADLGPLKLLNDSVRDLMRDFKQMEAPFLNEPAAEREKDVERSEESARGDYAPMTLGRRWVWLRRKDDFKSMATQVTRIQTRRIAYDTTCCLMKIHNVERMVESLDDRLWDLEEHVMGERLEDGQIYVKRRVASSRKASPS